MYDAPRIVHTKERKEANMPNLQEQVSCHISKSKIRDFKILYRQEKQDHKNFDRQMIYFEDQFPLLEKTAFEMSTELRRAIKYFIKDILCKFRQFEEILILEYVVQEFLSANFKIGVDLAVEILNSLDRKRMIA